MESNDNCIDCTITALRIDLHCTYLTKSFELYNCDLTLFLYFLAAIVALHIRLGAIVMTYLYFSYLEV